MSSEPSSSRLTAHSPKLSLHQFLSQHIQSHGGGEAADAFSVAGEGALHHFGAGVSGYSVKDQAYRLIGGASGRAGYAGDSDAKCRFTAVADAFGQSCGDFATDGSVTVNHFFRHAREFGLQLIRVDDSASEKISGAAADGSDALGEEPSGAGLGDGDGGIAHLKPVTDDLLERLSIARVDGIV